jgi:hypothetical protein
VKRFIFILASLLLLPVICSGTTLQKLTLQELRTHAATVIVGRVAEIRYQTINGRIWTLVELQVEQALKGTVSGRIHFRIPGGMQSVNGRPLVTRVDGVPQIQLRDRGVFFLEHNPPAFADLVGWNQGFYRLIEKDGKEYVLSSDNTRTFQTFEQFLIEFRKDFISK